MEDAPYTTPDEDPFIASPIRRGPRRRRSSMLDKWLHDQQQSESLKSSSPECGESSSSQANRWLAYPELSKAKPEGQEDTNTLHSFDLVDDTDIPDVVYPDPIPPIHASIRSRFIRAPSLRSFSLTLRSNSSTASRSPSPPATASSRKSFFHLPSRPNSVATPKHSRSFSLSAMSMLQAEPTSVRVPASSAKWRPSVLGYFSSSSQVTIQDTEAAPPRPSLSSTLSRTSATSTTYLDHTTSPSRLSLVSSSRHRPQNPSHGGGSNFSVWSQPDILEESVASRSPSSRSGRGPLQDKSRSQNIPQMATASPKAKSASKLSLPGLTAIRGQRKKKLVISGIHEEDDGKMEAARRWCESFGELSHFDRLPNGDLQISFQSADVADTVCRLRTRVFIASVGSVQLSWFIGTSTLNS